MVLHRQSLFPNNHKIAEEPVVHYPLKNYYYDFPNVPWAMTQDKSGLGGDIVRIGHNIAMFADDFAAGEAVAAEPCKPDSGKSGS